MKEFKSWVHSSFSSYEEIWDTDLRVVCKIEKSKNSLDDSILIVEAGEVRSETGKTPRQLAEENAKLRAIAENFVRVMNGDSSGSVCTSDLEQVAYEARAFLQE